MNMVVTEKKKAFESIFNISMPNLLWLTTMLLDVIATGFEGIE